MAPKLTPARNDYGRNISAFIPVETPGILSMPSEHREIWERAKQYLRVRNNDAHTLYAYGLAQIIADGTEHADPAVVLPAILLHDTGWSQVPEELVLEAISPEGGNPEAVRWHEREGVRIATEILTELDVDAARTAEITDIIAEHDSLKLAKSVNDAVVKDADKLWRLSPHGVDTVMDWFGLERASATKLCSVRVYDFLHTDIARVLARGFGAIASVDTFPERIELLRGDSAQQ